MRGSIYRLSLDMQATASQVQITAKQYDTARKIYVTLTEDGIPHAIEEGCEAVMTIKKPNGAILLSDCDIDLINSVIMYEFGENTASTLGLCECEVKVTDPNDVLITSPRFTMLVAENVYNDGDEHGSVHNDLTGRDAEDCHPISAITDLSGTLTAIEDDIDALEGSVQAIPAVTSADNGMVLKVVDGAWDKANESTGLPSVTSADNGKILQVVNGAWGAVNLDGNNIYY